MPEKARDKKLKEKNKNYTRTFNNLPYDVRHIGSMKEWQMRIEHLKEEKARLRKAYRRSLNVVNRRIRSLENWILRDDRQSRG